jgi:hypothetical protein
MKSKRANPALSIFLLGVLITSCGNAWADACSYSSPGAAVGDVGMGGTGTGGTGDLAAGRGAGGTGMRLGVYMREMPVAGQAIIAQGAVEAKSYGRSRTLAKGDQVCVGETVVTAPSAQVKIKMADDSLVSLLPQSQFKIEEFAYNGGNADKSLLTLLKGSCHVVAGKIPQDNVLKTPNATISSRESDHEITVVPVGDARNIAAGTYDKVNAGVSTLKTAAGEIEIEQNQTGFAPSDGEPPVLLEESPKF